MNRKKKQDRDKSSTRQLMGITDITAHSLVTGYGELVFFNIKPTNISVLSDASVGARIYALMNVLKGIAEIEMLCLNSRENFEDVKSHLQHRMDDEQNPVIRKLLGQDTFLISIASSANKPALIHCANVSKKLCSNPKISIVSISITSVAPISTPR